MSERDIQRRLAALHRSYMESIQPFLKIKSDIYAISMPTIIITTDGVTRAYEFNEQQKKLLAQVDEFLDSAKKRYNADAHKVLGVLSEFCQSTRDSSSMR